MRFRRALTLSLSVALLGVPALVATAGTASATEALTTQMTMDKVQTVMQYKTTFSISGTLKAYDATGAERSLSHSQTVSLERQDKGTSTWTQVGTYDTYGSYYFSNVVGWKNATFRVSFAGGTQPNWDTNSDDTLGPSSVSAKVWVARKLNDKTWQKSLSSPIYLKGNVNPGWGNKLIHLQKKSCRKCSWHDVAKQRTTGTGTWSFRLGAPRTGNWYWRAYIGGSTDFIKSWSDSWITYRL